MWGGRGLWIMDSERCERTWSYYVLRYSMTNPDPEVMSCWRIRIPCCYPSLCPRNQEPRILRSYFCINCACVCVCVCVCCIICSDWWWPFRPKFIVANNKICCVLTGLIVLKLCLYTYNNFLMKVTSDGLSVYTSVCLFVYIPISQLTHPHVYVAHTRVEQEL